MRRTFRKRAAVSSDEEESTQVLQDVQELRKLRKKATGIATFDLQSKQEKVELDEDDDPWKLKSGGGIIDIDAVRGKFFGDDQSKGTFATESKIMDTEKLMKEYIDSEMRKKRGMDPLIKPSTTKKEMDNLFQVPDHLKQYAAKPVNDNITIPASMLFSIPEVHLGMSSKLQAIADTQIISTNKKANEDNEMNQLMIQNSIRFWKGGSSTMSSNAGKPLNFEKHAELLDKMQKQMLKKRQEDEDDKSDREDRPKGPGRIRNI